MSNPHKGRTGLDRIVRAVTSPDTNSPASPPGRPFDVRDYGAAAEQIGAAARIARRRIAIHPAGIAAQLHPKIVERLDHPWFIGVQFHPELKSRPFAPHPQFASFIAAAKTQSRLV